MALLTSVVPGDLVQKAVLVLTGLRGGARGRAAGAGGRRRPPVDGGGGRRAGLRLEPLPRRAAARGALDAARWPTRPCRGSPARHSGCATGRRARCRALVLACAPAALTPTGAVLAGGVVVALAGRRALPLAGGAVVALALPWIVAGALPPVRRGLRPRGRRRLRRPSGGLGRPAALPAGPAPASGTPTRCPRAAGSALVPVTTLLLVGLAAVGWSTREALRGPGRRLVALGTVGLLLALAATLPGTSQLLEFAVREVPGAGLLRDAQKWVAWWGAAAGRRGRARRPAAGSTGRAARAWPRSRRRVAGAALLLPVIAVPDLVWGVGGRLRAGRLSGGRGSRCATALAGETGPGDVLVLPFGAYRAFAWNDARPQLDPAPRWLPRPVVVDDELVVDARSWRGGRPCARRSPPPWTTRRARPPGHRLGAGRAGHARPAGARRRSPRCPSSSTARTSTCTAFRAPRRARDRPPAG